MEIIGMTIEVMRGFEKRAKEIAIDSKTIEECKKNIENQIELLSIG